MNVVDQIGRLGLVPVIEITNAALAVPLGQALLAAGLPFITWMRFAIWLVAGMTIYIFYGHKRSELRRTPNA